MEKLALHETMELHEILNLKTTCLLKSKMLQGLLFDQELKKLMQKDVELSIKAINSLQSILLIDKEKEQL